MRAKVGDRYVMAELLEREWLVGGENSGHVVCCNHTTTGDAIIAALQVLMALKRRGETPPSPSGPAQVPAGADQRALWRQQGRPAGAPVGQGSQCQGDRGLGRRGRVLLRKSGTEPLVRVMVEGEDESRACACRSAGQTGRRSLCLKALASADRVGYYLRPL